MLIHTLALGFLLSSPPLPVAAPPADDWLDLDAEVTTLSTALAEPGLPAHISGRLIATYFMSRDPYLYTGSMEHASGVDLRSARLVFTGGDDKWSWKLQGELADGNLNLVDAWLSRHVTSSTALTMGRFKRPVTQAAMLSSSYRMFWERENIGVQTKDRDFGVKAVGDYGQFHGYVSAMNGTDGTDSSMFVSGRVEYDMAGEPFDKYEGAYGAPEGLNMGFAVAGADDGGLANGVFSVYEFEITHGGFFLGLASMNYDAGYDETGGFSNDMDLNSITGGTMAGTTPFTATSSLLFGDSHFELAGRIEVFDDDANTSRTSFSFSVYDRVLGPRSRIMVDYADVTSDNDDLRGDKLEVGYILLLAD